MQFRKDHEYMDDWSSKIDDYIAEHKKQLAVPKPVSVEEPRRLLSMPMAWETRSARTSPGSQLVLAPW